MWIHSSGPGRARLAVAGLLALAVAALAAPAAGAGTPKANDCADPYWVQTLRCQHAAAGEPPQRNLGSEPATAADIEPFTRVFLTGDPKVRSVDGTYPILYVDKAVCTDEGGCGDVPHLGPVESDKWLITVQGGGSCFQDSCLTAYADAQERGEMSTAMDPPTKSFRGIHTPTSSNPVFAGYNRVRVEKSTYDRYQGRATYETEDGVLVFNHGFLLMEEALRALRKGLRYDTWVDVRGQVARVREELPALVEAEQVVFAGHSGGAHGMVHNVDRLASLLDSFGGFRGDVRAVLDENFVPGIQNESAFSSAAGGNAYADQWSGASSGNGAAFAYDGMTSLTTGLHAQQYLAWDAPMDASCLKHHKQTDGATWKCHERQHVVLNHIGVPFFVKQDFSDPNTEHNNKPIGHHPMWAPDGITFTYDEFARRVAAQAAALIELSSSHSEPARLGRPFPLSYVWIGNCGTHGGVYDDHVYFGTAFVHRNTRYTLREWVERFVQAPPGGPPEFRVHRYGEPDPLSEAPPRPGSMLSAC